MAQSIFNILSSLLWAWAVAEVVRGYVYRSVYIGARIYVDRQSEKLSAQADRDELTGLYNRRFVIEYINHYERGDQLIIRAYALITTDVDHFKDVNDKYGHETGDKVLISFSKALQSHFRKEDMVARWGGEEFIIELPDCTLKEASAKAEAVRDAIADEPLVYDLNQAIDVAASFG